MTFYTTSSLSRVSSDCCIFFFFLNPTYSWCICLQMLFHPWNVWAPYGKFPSSSHPQWLPHKPNTSTMFFFFFLRPLDAEFSFPSNSLSSSSSPSEPTPPPSPPPFWRLLVFKLPLQLLPQPTSLSNSQRAVCCVMARGDGEAREIERER